MNYGTYWNIDHDTPVSAGNLTKETLKTLCHYTNLIPMLITENSSKCATLIETSTDIFM
jgi:hypothetical protein